MFKKTPAPQKTFRLIPTKYPPIQTFDNISSTEDLEALMELEGWTNDRLVKNRILRLPKDQWVYGENNSSIIMAAFLHTPEFGLRFNKGELGAWYCSTKLKTSIAEISTHLRTEAINCDMGEIRSQYRSYTAKLSGQYLDIRNKQSDLPEIYQTNSWKESQIFGENIRSKGENGIYYNSLRHTKGNNIVAFKPKNIKQVTISNSFDIIVPKTGKIIARKIS